MATSRRIALVPRSFMAILFWVALVYWQVARMIVPNTNSPLHPELFSSLLKKKPLVFTHSCTYPICAMPPLLTRPVHQPSTDSFGSLGNNPSSLTLRPADSTWPTPLTRRDPAMVPPIVFRSTVRTASKGSCYCGYFCCCCLATYSMMPRSLETTTNIRRSGG